MHKENGPKIIGRWFDTIHRKDGSVEAGEQGMFEWGFNQIQDVFSTLLAALCKGEAGYSRISYMGIGSGLVGWDTTAPTKSLQATSLTTEFFRKAVAPADMIFIDPTTDLDTGGTPSPKMEITVTLDYADAIGALREFGLFGGTATTSLNSGQMVNWISHGRIDKDGSMQIVRKVRLEFRTDEFSP
jgi:hypothetical protein